MNNVVYYTLSMTTGTTQSTQIQVQKYDQLMLYVPALSTVAGSGVITASLKIGYGPSSAATAYYYDYVSAAPAECKITMTTGGVYEIPNAGSGNYIQFAFDVAATQATTCYILTPKGTY